MGMAPRIGCPGGYAAPAATPWLYPLPSPVVTYLLTVEGLDVEVTRKRVRRVNLGVHPPEGRVRVSAPHRTSDAEIAAFVVARRSWIDGHRERLRREAPIEVRDGATIRLWGEPMVLELVESGTRGRVTTPRPDAIVVRVPPGSSLEARRRILDTWLRTKVATEVRNLVVQWSPVLGVEVTGWTVRRMTSRWGSASPARGRITLNLDLAGKPREYLEYVVVHEMVHLVTPGHGRPFQRLMDRHLPGWRERRRDLNRGTGQGAGAADPDGWDPLPTA